MSAYTLDHGPLDRVGSSLAAGVAAALRGADYVRTHDVRAMRQFKEVWNAISTDEA